MPLKRIFLFALLASLSYTGCKNTYSGNNTHIEGGNAFKKPWYKRFTGTVAGQQVAVNLSCSGKVIQGSFYYTDKGIIIDLLPSGHGSTGDVTLSENNPLERANDEDTTNKNNWQLSIHDTAITGKWVSGDGKRMADINLKEAYPAGSYPLDVLVKGDSKEERKEALHVTAASLYELVQPAGQMNKADADFLRTAILHFLGGEFADAENINDYVLQEDKKYFDNFEKLLADMKIDREAHEDWEYNFEHTRKLIVLYNNNGMLALRLAESDRTGGGVMGSHFRNRYVCIDVEQKRSWQMRDIMAVDAAKLSPLLNDEARIVWGIPMGPLTEKLRVDEIPLTDNIYVTGMGITFCYFPGVIAREEDGEICLFIPYAKIKDLLKEDFKKRMSL